MKQRLKVLSHTSSVSRLSFGVSGTSGRVVRGLRKGRGGQDPLPFMAPPIMRKPQDFIDLTSSQGTETWETKSKGPDGSALEVGEEIAESGVLKVAEPGDCNTDN